jgi:hypothetical protein
MKLRNLLEDVNDVNQQAPKKKLSEIMINFKSIIERYEKDGEIHKDDQSKMETLKDMITHMVKEEDRRSE